jgi:fumarate reductase flavoprotein subunit
MGDRRRDEAAVDVDVVVAGSGAAGTAAAIAAGRNGASVLLIDGRSQFAAECNTAMSTSMIPAAGSRWQQEAGLEDSPENFRADIAAKTQGTADPVVTRALTDVAPELVAWLADVVGVPLGLVLDFNYPGHSVRRCHSVPDRSGASLLRYLLAAVERDDNIMTMVPAALRSVTTGPINTVRLSRPDGSTDLVRCHAVVLATNGYAGNSRLVERYLPEIASGLYFGSPGSDGTALQVAEQMGADVGFLDSYQGHGTVAHPHAILLTWVVMVHGGVLVNRLGRRFGDESAGYSEFARVVLAQPEGVAYAIYDDRIHELCLPFADYQSCLAAGAVRTAPTIEALAADLGLPVEALSSTVEQARQFALGATTDPLGRSSWEAPLSAPFRAVRVTGALFHTQGGIKVDEHARVLRRGQVVPGVYAAGGAAVGISGHGAAGYLAGNGLLAALGLGYLAGRHAAMEHAAQRPFNHSSDC